MIIPHECIIQGGFFDCPPPPSLSFKKVELQALTWVRPSCPYSAPTFFPISKLNCFECPRNPLKTGPTKTEAYRTQKLSPWLNLATTWHHLHYLQIWPPDGATCITCKVDHQMAPLALFANLATICRHSYYLQILPPDGATCISCKFYH